MAEVLGKRTAPNDAFQIDCSGDLPPGVTINSVQSVLPDQVTVPPLIVSAAAISVAPTYFKDTNTTAPAGTCITVAIGGGAATPFNAPYLIRFAYTGSDGLTYESDGYLLVNDNPPLQFRNAA